MADSKFAEGRAALSPADPVRAGDPGCWTLALTIGDSGLLPGSAVRVSIPHGFTPPQIDNPNAPGYVQAHIGNPAAAHPLAVEPVPGEGGDAFRDAGSDQGVYLFLEQAPLKAGDQVRLVYGSEPGRASLSRTKSL